MLLALLSGCLAPSTDTLADSAAAADSGTADTDTAPVETYGTVPEAAIALPDFVATSDANAPRNRDDLLGHPTVMWFYPAAGTAG